MLRCHVSRVTVVDTAGILVGIVSEGDVLRRSEIGAAQAQPVSD
jgi:CBS domain-containing protein